MIEEDVPFALVVDDDAIIRMGACDIFKDAGFNCLDAADAEEGLSHLERHFRDIVLLFTDVDLGPGLDGYGLAATASERWPHIGILIASGGSVPEPAKIPEGATFIRKPFSAVIVRNRLHEVLADGQKPSSLRRPDVSQG